MITAEEAIERITARFGLHPGQRALHAKGITCRGSFTATAEAGALVRAPHMQGEPVEVIARLSNGAGDPGISDKAPDVRGLAVGFELPGGERTDIVSQSAPRFPVSTPDDFIGLLEAVERGPAMALRLPLFLARHPRVLPALAANAAALKAPASYASVPYYAVHAFRFLDAGDAGRWVRYAWIPDPEDAARTPAAERGPDYLADEVRERLPERPIRFQLEVQLAGPGDDPHNPASQWPADRERVRLGAITLDRVDDELAGTIFDPLKLTDGIEPSDDPVLAFRPGAYSVSFERRTASA